MRYVGRVTEWNDEKGFGFVTPNGGGDRAFVHVKSFEQRGRRPAEGDLISYEPIRDERRRLNAARIRHVVVRAEKARRNDLWFPRRTIGITVLFAFAFAAYSGRIPQIVALIYGGMSLIAFFAYGLDKSAARTDRRRIQESSLHLLELLCGWPGALIAQGSFRHKTRKLSFQIVFWFFVVVNLGMFAWMLHSGRINELGEHAKGLLPLP